MITTLMLVATLAGPPAPANFGAPRQTFNAAFAPVVAKVLDADDAAWRAQVDAKLREVERVSDGVAGDVFWIGMGAAADLSSTAMALRNCEACGESNPIGFNTESRVSLKVAAALVATGSCYKLRRDGHHRAATIVRWVAAGIQFVAAGNNLWLAVKK